MRKILTTTLQMTEQLVNVVKESINLTTIQYKNAHPAVRKCTFLRGRTHFKAVSGNIRSRISLRGKYKGPWYYVHRLPSNDIVRETTAEMQRHQYGPCYPLAPLTPADGAATFPLTRRNGSGSCLSCNSSQPNTSHCHHLAAAAAAVASLQCHHLTAAAAAAATSQCHHLTAAAAAATSHCHHLTAAAAAATSHCHHTNATAVAAATAAAVAAASAAKSHHFNAAASATVAAVTAVTTATASHCHHLTAVAAAGHPEWHTHGVQYVTQNSLMSRRRAEGGSPVKPHQGRMD